MSSGIRIPFLDLKPAYQELKGEIDSALEAVLERNLYLFGPELEGFEAEYAAFCGARYGVGVGNGLDALILSLRALDIGPGDEVIVPANTYIASWLAVSAVGARPVPVEPLPGLWTLNPQSAEAAVGPRTRAIMPVHLYGRPADLDPLLALARKRGLKVVEDAAQAHGASYRGRRLGAHGHLVAWSFYPGKNLGAYGDGGGVTTDDRELADRLRMLRNYGSRVKYYNEVKGVNSRLDEVQAAVLRVKLRHLDAWNARRKAVAAAYLEGLKDAGPLTLPGVLPGADSVWHLFVVDHPRRDRLAELLAEAGVQTQIHYPVPPHLSGAYADQTWPSLPVTEAAAATHLSLPIGPHLNSDQVAEVIRQARRCSLLADRSS